MNRLLRDLFFASALGALLGNAIGIFIRRRNERMAATAPVQRSRASHAPELAVRWYGRNPNSIG